MDHERNDPEADPERAADGETGGEAGDQTGAETGGTGPHQALRAKGGRRGRGTRPTYPDRPCLNCGDPTPGEYCPSCGQRKVDIQVSVRALFMEVLEDDFVLDRRLPRTLGALLFKPGFLTIEHVNGRIVRYIHPFRLYLVSSILFFLLLSFLSLQFVRRVMQPDGEPATAVESGPLADSLAALRVELADTSRTDEELATLRAREAELMQRQRPVQEDTAAVTSDTPPAESSTDDRPLREVLEWDENPPTINFGPIPAVETAIQAQVQRIGAMTPREAAETLLGTFFNYVPTMMFILLPLFAAVLKLLYIRRRRFYAEHFVFLLHVHSVVFLLAMLMLLMRRFVPALVEVAVILWGMVYILLAMKRVYGQGWLKTLVKYWTLGWMYFWILSFSIPIAFIATLLLF